MHCYIKFLDIYECINQRKHIEQVILAFYIQTVQNIYYHNLLHDNTYDA